MSRLFEISTWRSSLVFASALFAGCAPNYYATFDDEGLRSLSEPYRLETSVGPMSADSDWVLDNVTADSGEAGLVAKMGHEYERTVKLDADGDGHFEGEADILRYGLLLRHRSTDARISLSYFPIAAQHAHTELAVLARDYIDAASGSGSLEVDWGDGTYGKIEKRFASRVLDIEPISVQGYEAIGVTFEIANVDQLQLSGESRWARARMILIRPPWAWSIASALRVTNLARVHDTAWPGLIRILHTARPEMFERTEADFAAFVESLRFGHEERVVAENLETLQACFAEKKITEREISVMTFAAPDGKAGTLAGAYYENEAGSCLRKHKLEFEPRTRGLRLAFRLPLTGPWAAGERSSLPAFGETWPRASLISSTSGGEEEIAEAPTNEPEASPEISDVHTRLIRLKSLHEEGLITDEEYEAQRGRILEEL